MKGNLLLIDDEPLLIENMRFILKDLADEIFTVETATAGLGILRKNTVHCIVCDINMPGMNGVELIRKIRADKNEVPFIFYTGHGTRDLMLEAAKYGAFDFLDKPKFDDLQKIVRSALKSAMNPGTSTPSDYMTEYAELLKDLEK